MDNNNLKILENLNNNYNCVNNNYNLNYKNNSNKIMANKNHNKKIKVIGMGYNKFHMTVSHYGRKPEPITINHKKVIALALVVKTKYNILCYYTLLETDPTKKQEAAKTVRFVANNISI